MADTPHSYAPFDGLGDSLIQPMRTSWQPRRPETPKAVTVAQAQRLLNRLLRDGTLALDADDGMLWVLLAWSAHHHREFSVVEESAKGEFFGYWFKLMDVPDAPYDDEHSATQS